MMRSRHILALLLLTIPLMLSGQYTKEFKRIFLDAEYLYLAGFYEEAFNRYKNLLTLDPGNNNILFHCGACCLNIPGSEQQAITYLKEATGGVTKDYKDHSHKEPGSPVLTYYMLGRAYHLHNDFEDAIENYKLYQEVGTDEDPMQLEYAALQIDACERASKVIIDRPAFEFQSVLDHFDEDLPSCNNPVISGDGNTLIFLVDYPSDKKIMQTTRTGNLWSRPRVINSEIGMVGDTYPVCLSYDGKDLYFAHQYYSHSDIFVSSLEGGRWSEARALGHNINRRTSENHASISKDGQTLYFTSDARGSLGSFDIFVSHLDDKGEWGIPSNLGPTINTPYEEHTPFISSNDSILFFSSQGHASIGGVDVFYSELQADGTWGVPVSLGYPVNTTGDDLFFNPGWDELEGYYAVRREDDPTSNTINMVIELEPEEQVAEVVDKTIPIQVNDPAEGNTQDQTVAQDQTDIPDQTDSPDQTAAPVQTTVPVQTAVQEEVADPEEEQGVKDETVQNDLPVNVEAKQPSTITEVIEPEETDRIEEVLNRNAQRAEEDVVEKTAQTPVAAPVNAVLHTSIPFEHNEYELNMAAMLEVEKVADLMVTNPSTKVELLGHADATGPAEYNMLLSLQRSNQVADYLEMRGIEKSRITVEAKGEEAPIAKNAYEDGKDAPLGRYINRQVYVKISGQTSAQTELAGLYVPKSLRSGESQSKEGAGPEYWFSIQVRASRSPINLSRFQGLNDMVEYACDDDLYRYASGSFKTFQEARDELKRIYKLGYEDAFIQTLEWFQRHAK